jgi:hypothetical protein
MRDTLGNPEKRMWGTIVNLLLTPFNAIECFYCAMPFRQSKARCDARLYIKRR